MSQSDVGRQIEDKVQEILRIVQLVQQILDLIENKPAEQKRQLARTLTELVGDRDSAKTYNRLLRLFDAR